MSDNACLQQPFHLLALGWSFGMLNRYQVEELKENHREQIIANGKAKFVRREIGFNVLLFVIVMTAIYLADGRSRGVLFAIIAVLPISVLGGYLRAIWKWQDITGRRS